MSMKVAVLSTSMAVLAAAPLTAHAPDRVTPDGLLTAWTFEPLVVVPLAIIIWLYLRGISRVWARAGRWRIVSRANVLAFAAGIAALVVALVSPLDSLGGTLLSAHMVQHGLLAGVAPPLLVMSRLGVASAWALRPLWRSGATTIRTYRWTIAATRRLSTPVLATVLHAVMLWLWHAPTLFDTAVANDWVHALQHLCFFVPALLFWRFLLDARTSRRAGMSMVAAFVTFMHTGLLGGLLSMAPEPLYPSYFGRTDVWGFTALQDQQLAGMLMWVPLGLPYLIGGLWLASRVLARSASSISSAPPRRETA